MATPKRISVVGVKARDLAIKGADYLADAVSSTLGPFGQNALLEKGHRITNDGFTISSQLVGSIENEFERLGATILHEASSKTNDQVGDATTTSETLARAIIKEAVKLLPKEGGFIGKKTAAEVRNMIEMEKKEVIEKLYKMTTGITDEQTLINSARVSVEDEELARLIGPVQWQIGKDGFILCEDTAEKESSIQIMKGVRIDNGFGASHMINNQEKQTLELSNVHVILTNHTIGDFTGLKPMLDELVTKGVRHIAIIARGFTSDAIRLCSENQKQGLFIYPINAPYTDQAEVMRDLQAVLGGTYIDSEEMRLEDATGKDAGFAVKVTARRWDAMLVGKDDGLSAERVQNRLDQLNKKLAGEVSDFAKRGLESRIAQLTNGFALLKVGATNAVSRKYKKDKADDAVNAVRLALKGGTVKGAGLAFKEISETIPEGSILKKPLTCINDKIMASAPADFKVEEWVRDPFLVLKAALENACDVASDFATINIIETSANTKDCDCE